MTADIALEAHGIGKRYRRGRPWALRDVDLAIPAGSITALVGPNGAGKSTLIKGYVGFEKPTEGRLLVAGVDPWKDRGAAVRRIGYVPQAASLYRELTVSDHLALAARWRDGFDTRAAELRLDQLDIPLDARADELSRSEYATGASRVARLCHLLEPRVLCVVGLTGWRIGVDKRAATGPQPEPIGRTIVYVMPNPSGLNAHVTVADLAEHFRIVGALADQA